MEAHEVGARHSDCVTETTEVGSIFHFLGEDVAAVDYARDMGDEDFAICLCLSNLVFAEVDVFGAFVSDRGGPINAGLVVVVNCCWRQCVSHAHVGTPEANSDNFLDAFVCSHDFGLAGALGCLCLADGFPGDGAATAADDIS